MKHLIILGDGMADHPIAALGGKTPLQHVDTPAMDYIASHGLTGTLATIPAGYQPGSEVANTAILGYDLDEVYEGRGPLEAASIGYEMQPGDMAARCNIISVDGTRIINHHGGHLTTAQAAPLIDYLNRTLATDRAFFVTGIQYRHLLVVRGGNKHIVCAPPHDHPDEPWRELLVKPEPGYREQDDPVKTDLTAAATASLLNGMILRSQELLAKHPLNIRRAAQGQPTASTIWPWSPGYRPSMDTLGQRFAQISRGAVISAVDLIRGIGHYAGLRKVIVPGATGLADTNYEGKARAAIDALRTDDFVFLHIEASDEAGHDGDLQLKELTIRNLDRRIVAPVLEAVQAMPEPVCIALLPDHPTPVEIRTHVAEPVPVAIWHKGIQADAVSRFDEVSCRAGALGQMQAPDFIRTFMNS